MNLSESDIIFIISILKNQEKYLQTIIPILHNYGEYNKVKDGMDQFSSIELAITILRNIDCSC